VITTDDGSADTTVMPVPDTAGADALRRDRFSADWLEDSEPASRPDPESRSPEQAEAQASSAATDNWFTPRETPDPEPTWSPAAAEASAAAPDTWFTPRERAEGRSASPQPTEVQRPGPSPTQEHAIPRASWPAAAEAPAVEARASDTAAADRTMPVQAQAAPAAPSRTIAGPAVPPGPVVPPGRSRSDRLYPVRLLVVIMVAALLGSILVLLLR
jgi:hypothetical protein